VRGRHALSGESERKTDLGTGHLAMRSCCPPRRRLGLARSRSCDTSLNARCCTTPSRLPRQPGRGCCAACKRGLGGDKTTGDLRRHDCATCNHPRLVGVPCPPTPRHAVGRCSHCSPRATIAGTPRKRRPYSIYGSARRCRRGVRKVLALVKGARNTPLLAQAATPAECQKAATTHRE